MKKYLPNFYASIVHVLIIKLLTLSVVQSQTIVKEAENAVLTDISIATSTTGYSGSGYVYMADKGKISFTLNIVKSTTYNLTIRVGTPSGEKNQDLYLNGLKIAEIKFKGTGKFYDFNAGNLFLKAGTNTIEVRKNWGYMNFDKFTFEPLPPHNYAITDISLINPNASQKTKNVYAYLRSNYGNSILSGQTFYWSELIKLAGKTPAIQAFDMQNYSPQNPWGNSGTQFQGYDDGSVKSAIDWYNSTGSKGIVSFVWHWFSPSGGQLKNSTFYTDKTTFDVSKISDLNSQEYKDIIRDIDAIAIQLKRLQTANVPVLWRPLHEAGGKWFWWGAKGASSCLKLYDLMYDRLTNYHNLNNLIWVWSTPEESWYPGNSKVDIIGYDSYPTPYSYITQKLVFDQLFDLVKGKKMIAMTENGPIPDVDDCMEEDAMWSFFLSWGNLVKTQNTESHIKSVFAHANVITLDEVTPIVTSLDKKEEIKVFSLFPNPANETLNVLLSTNAELEITDLHGQSVFKMRADIGEMKLNISQLRTGIYFIHYQTPQGNQVFSFLKE